jgi:putative oxidoreductase
MMRVATEKQDIEMSKTPVERITELRTVALEKLKKLEPLALLLGRLGVGIVFLSTGWGKVHNIEGVTKFFITLGIPMPGLNAVVVAWSELLCGSALVLGVLSRLATIPLIVSMMVAIATAKKDDFAKTGADGGGIKYLFTLFAFDEFTYFVLLVMIAILGPGRWAVDTILAQKLAEKTK